MIEKKLLDELKEEIRKIVKAELNKPKKLYIETCGEEITLPEYAHVGDAGMDLRAAVDITLEPGETKVIPTGLKVTIPEGYEIQIRPRSGISAKTPLRLPNSPGTIDSGYKDEIGVILTNTSYVEKNEKLNTYDISEKENRKGIYKIKKGERIAQMVLMKHETIEFVTDKSKVENNVENRNGGFGHSGVN